MLPAFDDVGQGGTTVLLLHGIGGGRAIWSDAASGTARAIAGAGFRALAMDFPGYGDSVGVPDVDTMCQAVLALAAHAANAGARRTVLLGHSMGGLIAQEIAARVPQAIDGLVLCCTSASFGPVDGAWQTQFMAERLAPLDAGLGMAGLAAQLVPGLVATDKSHTADADLADPADPADLADPADPAGRLVAATAIDAMNQTQAAQQIARDVMSRVPEASYRSALQAIVAFDRRAALSHIAVPTLLLAGELDRSAPPAVMQRMAARIAGSQFVSLPGAGHIANVEVPQAFNEAVVTFLRRHFAAP
ncbi:MAG: alpha/beta hydrolase [Rubrivivax sp.]|nr:alpha/beta hydrolase [Rubrivivax sp.]